jgi:hypothetical protein
MATDHEAEIVMANLKGLYAEGKYSEGCICSMGAV